MTPEHKKLLTELKNAGRPTQRDGHINDSYGGSGRPFYNVSVPARRRIAKTWLTANKHEPVERVLETVESLFNGASHEEKTLACLLLDKRVRASVSPADVERWLGQLNGWAEVDSLCQNTFASEILAEWPRWSRMIKRLAKSQDINRRRAALVLLARPVHLSPEVRVRDLAFEVIEQVKAEKAILVTKAVSWLLRSMTTYHAKAVRRYLAQQAASLPKIAIRETMTKLNTGTKSGRVTGLQ